MTQPTTQTETTTVKSGKSLALPWIIVLATVTLYAVRWTGYAALPWLVIFAPLLTWVGVTALAIVLFIIASIIGAAVGRK